MQSKMQFLANLVWLQMQKFDNPEITKAVEILLENSILFDIISNFESNEKDDISSEKFQHILSSLNEKTLNRKDNGVYYTPNDVSRYIIVNSLLNRYYEQTKVLSCREGIQKLSKLSEEQLQDLVFKTKIIDPTCGGGEFIITAFDIKNELCTKNSDDSLLKIAKTIFGNDIDTFSVLICKIRFFFHICEKLQNKSSYVKLAKIICNQFYCVDFVLNHRAITTKFDIAIGNPPYVEYGKFPNSSLLTNKFGNIYADVLKNSFDILKKDGVIGYIIPISYSSTPRMKGIRDYINKRTKLQFILSFADRPDCLFNGVHQKLNIVIAKTGTEQSNLYTSDYQYWYKDERATVFDNIGVIRNDFAQSEFIPKLGNTLEQRIYSKICNRNTNINSFMENSEYRVYLNMRACFWIKAFATNPGSKEYKELCFPKEYRDYIMCVLNSSLFWFFWITISDCWHITAKDLTSFSIPNIQCSNQYQRLAKKLECELENTKKYIGSKQTAYEYKHRLCKDVIDEIDNELSTLYGLSAEELEYVKSFALKYRTGGGVID